ncbi:hypothetical protein D3C71_665200 [compost metagenome]
METPAVAAVRLYGAEVNVRGTLVLLPIQACGVPSTPPGEQGLLKLVEPGVAPQPEPKAPPLNVSFRTICPVEEPNAVKLTLCPQVIVVELAEALISH